MAKLFLYLSKPVYLPGDLVQGEAVLQTEKALKVRQVTVEASGAEKTVVTESHGVGKSRHTHTYTDANQILNFGAIVGPAGDVPPGEYRFPFEFPLPANALPTFHGQCASTFYSVRANADIPMWFDASQSAEIPVRQDRRACREDRSPLGFSTANVDDPSEPGFMARLDRITFFAGDFVDGTVTLTSGGGHRIRKAIVRLYTYESATAQGHTSVQENEVSKVLIPGDQLGPERAAPFRIYIPKDAPGSFSGMYSSVEWQIEIQLDVAWAFDVKESQDIVVFNAV